MTYRLAHIGFMFPGVPKVRDLEPVFDRIAPNNWIRYSMTSWLVWTDKSNAEILVHILAAIDPADNVFVSGVEGTDFIGRQPNWVWTWLAEKMPGGVATSITRPDVFAGLSPPAKR
jgi:hypothetical protein